MFFETVSLYLMVAFLVAVIGRGIWLIGQRATSHLRKEDNPADGSPPPCPECGSRLRRINRRCPECGFDFDIAPQQSGAAGLPLSELENLKKQTDRLLRRGILDQDQHTAICDVIRAKQRRLRAAEALPLQPLPKREPKKREVPTELIFEDAVPPPKPQSEQAPSPEPTVAEAIPAEPSQPLTDMLRAFMEQRNIRWGELVSGLLIVGSSIGLVISLWATLRDAVPYFPALLFLLATAAIHGAGVYTLKKWKLRSTSRGLLMIAGLLIPLNYLAAIALSETRPITDPYYIGSVLIGTIAFASMAYTGGRILLLNGTLSYFVALWGAACSQLLLSRQISPGMSAGKLVAVTAAPLVCFVVAMLLQLRQSLAWHHLTPRRVGQMLMLLGIGVFSLLVSLGLAAWKLHDLPQLLTELAPSLSLALIPVLGLALVIQRGAIAPRMAKLQVAGTSVAVLAALMMLSAVVFAWPRPELLIAVGLIDFVALSLMAVRAEFVPLHVPATAAVALAGLLGFHAATDNLALTGPVSGAELGGVLLMGSSSVVLTVFALLLAVAAGGLHRAGKSAVATAYLCSAAGLAAVSLGIAAYAGFVSGIQHEWTTPVFAVLAVAGLLANLHFRRSWMAFSSAGLLFVALTHGLFWNEVLTAQLAGWQLMPNQPFLMVCALHATICCVTAMAIWRRPTPQPPVDEDAELGLWHGLANPLLAAATMSSGLAVPAILIVPADQLAIHAAYGFWVTAVWLAVAFAWSSQPGMAAVQILSTISVGFLVTHFCRLQNWWSGSYLDPRLLQAQAAVMALWSMLWVSLRTLARPFPRWATLWNSTTTVDRVLLGAVTVASLLLTTAGCVPGIDAELRQIVVNPSSEGVSPVLFGLTILTAVGVFVAASLALIPKRRIAFFSGLSALTAAWAFPVWDDLTAAYWEAAGVSHTVAYQGALPWILPAVIFVALLVAMKERYSNVVLSGLLLISLSVPLLIAGQFEIAQATATVLRWTLALHGLVIAAIVCSRRYWLPAISRFSAAANDRISGSGIIVLRSLALTVTLTPIVALTLRQIVLLVSSEASIAGPVVATFLGEISAAWSLGIPLFLLSAVFAAYAVRERSPHFAVAASLMLNLTACVAVLLTRSAEQLWVEFFQWNAVICSGCAVVVYLTRRWIEPAKRWSAFNLASPLEFQVLLAGHLTLLLAGWATVMIIVRPGDLSATISILGGTLSYVAWVLASLAAVMFYRDCFNLSRLSLIPSAALGLVGLLAASSSRWNVADSWISFHVLLSGWSVVSVLCAAAAVYATYTRRFHDNETANAFVPALVRWSTAIGIAVVLLSVRSLWEDPGRPYWSAAPVAITALTAAGLALRGRDQRFAYLSSLLTVLATAFIWMQPWLNMNVPYTPQAGVHLAQACLSSLVMAGIVWLAVEVYWQRRRGCRFDETHLLLPIHRLAAALGLIGLICSVNVGLMVQHLPELQGKLALDVSNLGGWTIVASLAVLLCGSLWDTHAQRPLAGLYVLGLCATGLILHELELSTRNLVYGLGIASSAVSLICGAAWWSRTALAQFGRRMHVTRTDSLIEHTGRWLPAAQLITIGLCVLIAFWAVTTFEALNLRLYAAVAVGLTAAATAAFAQDTRRLLFQILTLSILVIAAVDVSWALMDINAYEIPWLHRAIRVLVVVSGMSFLYGALLLRMLPSSLSWHRAVKSTAGLTLCAALVSLAAVLSLEAYWYPLFTRLPLSVYEFTAVVAMLAVLIAGLISMAVSPGSDPLGLSERGRMFYVYAAEAVGALLFLHIYLTRPELFRGYIRPYWPLVVMAIAFCGVGVGELFSKFKLRVLAEPLRQTGVFLPLLPALGFWTLESRLDYSTVLFVAGLLYVIASMWRKNFWHAAAAGLAGNAGLWALWHEHGTGLFEHPQLWMIPPALSVLAAAHWHREKLSEAQLTALRYSSIIVIYVSSTGDMFITGVAESLWMPMILAGLSVAGVLAGIVLHVRAFVYLGASFLFVSIVSMVWHAARNINHVWPWWAFGIVMGLLILTLFGVFEKKRNEVLGLLGEFRQWEA